MCTRTNLFKSPENYLVSRLTVPFINKFLYLCVCQLPVSKLKLIERILPVLTSPLCPWLDRNMAASRHMLVFAGCPQTFVHIMYMPVLSSHQSASPSYRDVFIYFSEFTECRSGKTNCLINEWWRSSVKLQGPGFIHTVTLSRLTGTILKKERSHHSPEHNGTNKLGVSMIRTVCIHPHLAVCSVACCAVAGHTSSSLFLCDVSKVETSKLCESNNSLQDSSVS